jgi:predicted GNAT family N-acyltransferase
VTILVSYPIPRSHHSTHFVAYTKRNLYQALDMLMTKPEYQGKGAAAAHLYWGLKFAGEEKLPIFLEASPAAKALYLKFGFAVVGEVVHDLSRDGGKGEYVHSLMVRYVEG